MRENHVCREKTSKPLLKKGKNFVSRKVLTTNFFIWSSGMDTEVVGPYAPYSNLEIGFPSVIPPIMAMVLALSTKEVISSLFVGVLSAAIIYSIAIAYGMDPTKESVNPLDVIFTVMKSKIGGNVYICLFILFIGALINLVSVSGGSKAYGEWAKKTIKGRKRSMFSTAALGSMMFLDDYFNSITTSTVMQTVMEVNNVSKAKAAYIIHTLSTNMCITIPLTSWAAAIVSQIGESRKGDAFMVFLEAISFNIYSILSFILMIVVIAFDFDFGKMKFYEDNARLGLSETNTVKSTANNSDSPKSPESNDGVKEPITSDQPAPESKPEATMWDLLLPIIIMVILAVYYMFQLGGMWDGEAKDITVVLGNTDAPKALLFACTIALAATLVMYVPRKLMTFAEWINNFLEGMKSMVSTLVILVLAWSVSGTSGDLLKTGPYIGHLVKNSALPPELIPAVVFLVGMALSFATGTAWGTFSLLIPIAASICTDGNEKYLVPSIASCLCGAVFGNNTSPISDTTILVSSTLNCPFLLHVSTQLPYAVLVACISLVGFVVAGFSNGNLVLTWSVSLILLIVVLVIIWFHQKNTTIVERLPPDDGTKGGEGTNETGITIEMTEMSKDIDKPVSNDIDLDSLDMKASEA